MIILILIILGIIIRINSIIYDIKPSCIKCKSRILNHSTWIRGWHKDGNGAADDQGVRCYDCGYIKWDQTLEEYKSKLPEWVKAFEDYEQN